MGDKTRESGKIEAWRDRFRQRFEEMKAEKKMSQQDLANKVGREQVTISRWLRGINSPESLEDFARLAEALDVSPEWLIFGVSPPQYDGTARVIFSIYNDLPENLRKTLKALAIALLETNEGE